MTAPQFAALLHTHRREARMTQQELARKSGVSVRAISDMERGFSSAPQSRTLDALADALGLNTVDRDRLSEAARSSRTRTTSTATLPRDLPDFTGRTGELALLSDACRPGTVTLLHGPPGTGKTAVAVHAADRFPGHARFIDCHNQTPQAIRTRLARAGTPCDLLVLDAVTATSQLPIPALPAPQPIPAPPAPQPVPALPAPQPIPAPPAPQQVAALPTLLPWAECAIVITSRRPLPDLGPINRIPIGPLPARESIRLLSAITGTPADHPDLHRVADYCEHLPLALRAAGNRLVTRPGWTITDLAARLSDRNRRLANLTAGDLSVQRILTAAHTEMSPAERRTLAATSVLFAEAAP